MADRPLPRSVTAPTPWNDEVIRGPAPTEVLAGVEVRDLCPHVDERGSVMEVRRQTWGAGPEPVQWTLLHSQPGVIRGVHVHPRHADYLMAVSGRMTVGLCDLRSGSPTELRSAQFEMTAARPSALTVPAGVAHGFYFHEPTVMLLGVSHYWDTDDELGCRWDDPDLNLHWPTVSPVLSPRDQALPPMKELLPLMPAWTGRDRPAAEGQPPSPPL